MLRIEGISKSFGGLQALVDCTMNIEEDKIYGLIGPNGSGKTTLFNVITGVLKPDRGRVLLNEEQISGLRPFLVARRGIARTFQITRIYPSLTVLDNMLVAPRYQNGESVAGLFFRWHQSNEEECVNRERAQDLLAFFEMDNLLHEFAGNLSYGDQKKLEIARALMTNPRILLLDEPTAGVSVDSLNKLIGYIRVLRSQGMTFFIVEHRMRFLMSLAEYIYVLDHGKKIAEGAPSEVVQDQRVIEAYLGAKKERGLHQSATLGG